MWGSLCTLELLQWDPWFNKNISLGSKTFFERKHVQKNFVIGYLWWRIRAILILLSCFRSFQVFQKKWQ